VKLKLSQTDIEKICYGFLDDLKTNGYQVSLTRGGNVAIILNRSASAEYPLLGAYFTSTSFKDGQWLPCRWTESGEFAAGHQRSLDLLLVSQSEGDVA
jgi:hypothetical protein